jgi:hypothetical protein
MILGCIFAEKLVLEKGKVATTVFTEPIQLILRISEVLGSSKKKQEVKGKDGEKWRRGVGEKNKVSDRFSYHSLTRYPEPAGWRAGGQKLQPF